jgi:hypothetical protein
MSIRLVATAVSAVAGIGSAAGIAATAAPAAAPAAQLLAAQITPPAGTSNSGSSTTSMSTAAPACDDGAWHAADGVSVEGRPSFDAGDSGAAYVWHDANGWHVRTTDATRGAHHYTGSISASPGAAFVGVRPVRNERDDHVWVTGDNVLHYDLTTYRGVDGFDFRVTACAHDRDHEALRFSMDYNGREQDTARLKLGEHKQHPDSARFTVWRDV